MACDSNLLWNQSAGWGVFRHGGASELPILNGSSPPTQLGLAAWSAIEAERTIREALNLEFAKAKGRGLNLSRCPNLMGAEFEGEPKINACSD